MSATISDTGAAKAAEAFINRWKGASGENANRQPFLQELCDLLDVPRPNPRRTTDEENDYCFERHVTFHNGDGTQSDGSIDLYKRACFVLEAKETGLEATILTAPSKARKARGAHPRAKGYDLAMEKARRQAEDYIKALPRTEPQPPFLVLVDVGRSFELYADFSRAGKAYTPFPDFPNHRIHLQDLVKPEIRERLRSLFLDPVSLDPTRTSARVTREIAGKLADLARDLEIVHPPHLVAQFLMRCIFTMFAEDVGLLKPRSFTSLLESLRGDSVKHFRHELEALWITMNTGGYASPIREHVMRFNGGLFATPDALPLNDGQIGLLLDAARANWREVEPAIFGTLLERALDRDERAKLGAHYTPRAYVERLVMPTIIEPLRAEWETARANAAVLVHQGDAAGAVKLIRDYHTRLCHVRVLDPACGTGNFLYVSLDHIKRLEDEVIGVLHDYEGGLTQTTAPLTSSESVGPHQFLGIEINERAAPIADLVLWIGHLQWQIRTFGTGKLDQPILRNYHNIENRDALIVHDPPLPRLSQDGKPVTRWDGKTFKTHPVTGEQVPDETARTVVLDYPNVARANWPQAEYIIGNPPFLGPARMREALGDGYAEAVRRAYAEVPESADFVMYWWNRAAHYLRFGWCMDGSPDPLPPDNGTYPPQPEDKMFITYLRRFGFITTNSLRQTFNRRVLQMHMSPSPAVLAAPPAAPDPSHSVATPLSLAFAIPDHPWVDTTDGAAVRIAMTVAQPGIAPGILQTIAAEDWHAGSAGAWAATGASGSDTPYVTLRTQTGIIQPDLTIGAAVAGTLPLNGNQALCSPGMKLHGSGFIVTPTEAGQLGLGRIAGLEKHIRPYINGRDLTQNSRDAMVIDLFGLSEEQIRTKFPEIYQHVRERVKPERDTNNRMSYRLNWWTFGEPRRELRPALAGLPRYIGTVETSKHRFFVFLDASILPDNMLVCIALSDAYHLGVTVSQRASE